MFAGRRGRSRWSAPSNVVRDLEPSMGAEDFSFMLQVKPGAYLRIGQGGEGSCMLHNSRYDFNDDILPLGSALHASLVEQSHAAAGPLTAPRFPTTPLPSTGVPSMKLKTHLLAAAAARALAAFGAQAQTVRIANQGDALSMDPHSLNESLQLCVTGNVYEPLVGRNKDLSLAPGAGHLAGSRPRPTVWRFELRKGVQFHDGTPFTADDVVFSLRARRRSTART